MFQMELMRRNASGRLSELVGGSALRQDRYMRTIGLRRRAETELAALDPATRARLDAYAAGVNAWIARRGRFSAPEFIPLGTPEPWTPVDSLLWGKTMALYLSGNYRDELARLGALQGMSPEQVRALWPKQGQTLPPDARLGPAATRLAGIIPAFLAPFTQPRTASDEWAVDGANSVTGSPLLAGDPHLGYGMPGIWYLARIDTPTSTLAGATAPGLPFLVLGRNRKIAWTFTTTGADTQDVFIETGLPDGRYQTPDGPRAFESHEERIKVRGQADEVIQVRETRHGPVLSDLDGPGGPILAVSMASLAAGDTAADGLLALNRAASVAEAGAAAGRISAPVQNMLVADGAGIGLFTTGRVPLRRTGDGALPEPGASGAFDWTRVRFGGRAPARDQPRLGPAGQRQRAGGRTGFSGVHGSGLVRRLARPAHPGVARHPLHPQRQQLLHDPGRRHERIRAVGATSVVANQAGRRQISRRFDVSSTLGRDDAAGMAAATAVQRLDAPVRDRLEATRRYPAGARRHGAGSDRPRARPRRRPVVRRGLRCAAGQDAVRRGRGV